MFNQDITFYNSYKDVFTQKTKYRRVYLKGVYFDNLTSGSFDRLNDERVLCIIPFNANSENKKYLPMLEYKKMYEQNPCEAFFESYFTIQKDCKIILGIVNSPLVIDDQLELEREFDNCVTIKSVAQNDFGSKNLRHWEIRGR
jgi:hypothetical protein